MQKCKIIIINGNLLPEKNNSNKQTKKTNMWIDEYNNIYYNSLVIKPGFPMML